LIAQNGSDTMGSQSCFENMKKEIAAFGGW
jgi:hypothetical protein